MYRNSFIFPLQEKRNDFINKLLFIAFFNIEIDKNNIISFVHSDEKEYITISFNNNDINIYFIETENNEYGLIFESKNNINLKKIFFKIYILLYSENNKFIFDKEYKKLLERN